MKVPKTEPDMYKQEHPIESEELIEFKLQELEEELDKLSPVIKANYVEALARSPELVSRKEKLTSAVLLLVLLGQVGFDLLVRI